MSLDVGEVGRTAAELMDRLADDYADEETATVGVVAVVVEVTTDKWSSIEYRCSDERRWIQQGVFLAAMRAARTPAADEPDDDE